MESINPKADNMDVTSLSPHVASPASSSTLRQYTAEFKAPYTVFIRETSQCRLAPLSCSSFIHTKYKSVIDVVHTHGKMRVQLSDMNEANCLVADPRMKDLSVYIPMANVQVDGVISYNDVSDLDSLDELQSGVGKFNNKVLKDVDILGAFRLPKRSENGDNVRVATNLVKVSFAGRILPDYVVIFGLRIRVRPFYNNPMFCNNCQQFNHTSKFCKKIPKCALCHGKHSTEKCDNKTIDRNLCPYCQTPHAAGQHNCPHFAEVRECYKQQQERRQQGRYAQAVTAATPRSPNTGPNISSFPPLSNSFAVLDHPQPSTSATARAADIITAEQQVSTLLPPANPWINARKNLAKPSTASKRKWEPAKKLIKSAPSEPAVQMTHSTNDSAPGFQKCQNTLKEVIMKAVRNSGISNNWLSIIEAVLIPILDSILPTLPTLLASIVPMLLTSRL